MVWIDAGWVGAGVVDLMARGTWNRSYEQPVGEAMRVLALDLSISLAEVDESHSRQIVGCPSRSSSRPCSSCAPLRAAAEVSPRELSSRAKNATAKAS